MTPETELLSPSEKKKVREKRARRIWYIPSVPVQEEKGRPSHLWPSAGTGSRALPFGPGPSSPRGQQSRTGSHRSRALQGASHTRAPTGHVISLVQV